MLKKVRKHERVISVNRVYNTWLSMWLDKLTNNIHMNKTKTN